MRNVSNSCCREYQKTDFRLCDFFPENLAVCENVEKYGGAREAACVTMAARCMLNN